MGRFSISVYTAASRREGPKSGVISTRPSGYAALVMEQRCFGERETEYKLHNNRCDRASLVEDA